jgi:hypothetical protein
MAEASTHSPSGERLGAVCWLECGERPAEAVLSEVERLAATLGGRVVAQKVASHAVAVEVILPEGAIGQFKGALALAGGAFERAGDGDDTRPVVVLIGPQMSQPRNAGDAQ